MAEAQGPLGEGNYQVEAGDCMSSIAAAHGFFWETLWKLAENSQLKSARKNPNVLLPGDQVFIPEKRPRDESCATEKKHKFKKKGTPCNLKIRIMEPQKPPEHGASNGNSGKINPRANVKYLLVLDGKLIDGKTDADGMVEIEMPPEASEGTLTLEPGTANEVKYDLKLGGLDPIDQVSGVQARLNQLGFSCGAVDGKMGPKTRHAIKEFQQSADLKDSGEMDDATRAKLLEMYDGQK